MAPIGTAPPAQPPPLVRDPECDKAEVIITHCWELLAVNGAANRAELTHVLSDPVSSSSV